MADDIKRYPPEFDANKSYPRQYDLDKIDVFMEAEPGQYFDISGLPSEICFGKHSFSVFIDEPAGTNQVLKNFSTLLIEAKDNAGNLIFSGITDSVDVNGAAVAFLWIKRDPLRTTNLIQNGVGSITIVGELTNVPEQYRNVYNVRTTFPINIRTELSNVSPILFQSASLMQTIFTNTTISPSISSSISESAVIDKNDSQYKRSYINVSASHMETYGGKVGFIENS